MCFHCVEAFGTDMAQEVNMASIVLRKNRWRVQIRKQGHCYFSKTFLYKDNAEKWARRIEYEMDQGRHLINDGRDLNLKILLNRYLDEITILKKSKYNFLIHSFKIGIAIKIISQDFYFAFFHFKNSRTR